MKANWKVLVIAFTIPCLANFGWRSASWVSDGIGTYFKERPQRIAAENARRDEVRAHNAQHCFVTGTVAKGFGEGPEKIYGPVIEIGSSSEGRTRLEMPWGERIYVKVSNIKDCKK